MAGHSQFKNIMSRKEAIDTKRARAFAKLAREIMIACKIGPPHPESNPRLRAAIQTARSQNMPKDRIERLLGRVRAMSDGLPYEYIRYEGYGPGNVAVIVETLTDNRNRTASEIRAVFSKNGGSLGETNSVAFYFERICTFHYSTSVASADAILNIAIDVGASDVSSGETGHRIACAPEKLSLIREALERRLCAPDLTRLEWQPLMTMTVAVTDESTALNLLRFFESLENNEDVQYVAANYNIPKPLTTRLSLTREGHSLGV